MGPRLIDCSIELCDNVLDKCHTTTLQMALSKRLSPLSTRFRCGGNIAISNAYVRQESRNNSGNWRGRYLTSQLNSQLESNCQLSHREITASQWHIPIIAIAR